MKAGFDFLGQGIRWTPHFRGKARLIKYWLGRRDRGATRLCRLPGGMRVRCDFSVPYEAMVWLRQEEQGDLAQLQRLLEPGDTFVDCGANIGIWTLTATARVGFEGRVIAFEPGAVSFQKLGFNVRQLNGLAEDRVRLWNCAAGDEAGELSYLDNPQHNISRVVADALPGGQRVPVRTLDALVGDQRVAGIKIDVEGFEFRVLRGAERSLQRWRPWLCIEFNSEYSGGNRLQDWDVHQYLTGIGYQCRLFSARDKADRSLSGDWSMSGYCNLLYRPR